jgi:hypothetical protein
MTWLTRYVRRQEGPWHEQTAVWEHWQSGQVSPLTLNQEHVLARPEEAGGCMHDTLLTRWAASALPAWAQEPSSR